MIFHREEMSGTFRLRYLRLLSFFLPVCARSKPILDGEKTSSGCIGQND